MVRCKVEGCDGEAKSSGTSHRKRLIYKGKYLLLPKNCISRRRKCNKCGNEVRTIEIDIDYYVKSLKLVEGLKVLIRDYIEK